MCLRRLLLYIPSVGFKDRLCFLMLAGANWMEAETALLVNLSYESPPRLLALSFLILGRRRALASGLRLEVGWAEERL